MGGECQINGCGWKMNGKASKQHEVNKNDDDDDDRLKSFRVPRTGWLAGCLSVSCRSHLLSLSHQGMCRYLSSLQTVQALRYLSTVRFYVRTRLALCEPRYVIELSIATTFEMLAKEKTMLKRTFSNFSSPNLTVRFFN